MLGKRGYYDIIISFFTVTVLIGGLLFFLYADASSALLYGMLKKDIRTPAEAIAVKNALLRCHNINFLMEDKFIVPCPAEDALAGFKVVQLDMNGCDVKSWDFSRGGHTITIPFILAVQQAGGGRKCLARLEVYA